jgi:hypothetical protein
VHVTPIVPSSRLKIRILKRALILSSSLSKSRLTVILPLDLLDSLASTTWRFALMFTILFIMGLSFIERIDEVSAVRR